MKKFVISITTLMVIMLLLLGSCVPVAGDYSGGYTKTNPGPSWNYWDGSVTPDKGKFTPVMAKNNESAGMTYSDGDMYQYLVGAGRSSYQWRSVDFSGAQNLTIVLWAECTSIVATNTLDLQVVAGDGTNASGFTLSIGPSNIYSASSLTGAPAAASILAIDNTAGHQIQLNVSIDPAVGYAYDLYIDGVYNQTVTVASTAVNTMPGVIGIGVGHAGNLSVTGAIDYFAVALDSLATPAQVAANANLK